MVAPLVKVGITAAMMAAQMALGAMRKIEGPRLDTTKVTLAEYGTPLQDIYGIRRIEGCPLIWADDLRDEKKKTKGKAGKMAEYKYYADFAIAVAGHEIDAVRRIWFDNHLVFDRSGAGPVSGAVVLYNAIRDATGNGAIVKLTLGHNMRIYLGTETQEPDRLIESWFEDHDDFGPDCCSAMRGTAYIVFQDIPVEKFGNRIPTVTVEAVSSKASAYPYTQSPASFGASAKFSVSSNGLHMIRWNPGDIEFWDLPTRSVIGYASASFPTSGTYVNVAVDDFGTAYVLGAWLSPLAAHLTVISPSGVANYFQTDLPTNDPNTGPTRAITYNGGAVKVLTPREDGGYVDFATWVQQADTARDFCVDADGEIWGLFQPTGSSNQFKLQRITGEPASHTLTGTVTRSGPSTARICHVSGFEHFFVVTDGRFYMVDDEAFTIKASGAIGWNAGTDLPFGRPNAVSFWDIDDEWSLEDGTLLQTIDPNNWLVEPYGAGGAAYDPVSDAIMTMSNLDQDHVTWRYLDRLGSDGVTLGSIVEAEAERAGLVIEASALDQTVQGYSVTQGSVRDRIAPLLDLHDAILRPHGFSIEGKKHGTTSLGTIDVADFVREGDEQRYEVEETQAADLPQRMEVKFADVAGDQQTNNVIATRHLEATASVRVQPIDLSTYVDAADAMQQKAERFLRVQWNRRASVKNAVTTKHLALEPGDVYQLNLDGVLWTVFAEKLTFSATSPRIACEWRRTFPSLNDLGSGSGAGMGGYIPDVIIIPGPTKGFVFDLPLIEDADNSPNPQIYYGAGGYGTTWPGAGLYEGDLNAEYEDWQSVASDGRATWGYASNALGDANANLWDRGNVLTVSVFGTLSSSTEEAINASPTTNLAALRNQSTGETELLNFTTATLTGTSGNANVYELSGLKRGRRGTEWATSIHATGDEFILVEDLAPTSRGLSDVGTELLFKAQTIGRDPETAAPIALDFAGISLKPYAPTAFTATRNPDTGSWVFTWVRRTRVGGRWVDGTVTPLGEATEAYELVIGARVISTTTPTATWTAAMQIEDLGGTQSAVPPATVYQISADIGRGYGQSDLQVLNGVPAGSPTFRVRPMVASADDEVGGLNHNLGSLTFDAANQWMLFNGTTQYAVYASDAAGQWNAAEEWTLEAHVQLTTLPSGTACVLSRGSASTPRYYLHVMADGSVRFGATKFGGTLLESPATAITTGVAHHLAVTRAEDDSWTLFIDGAAVDTATWSSWPDNSSGANPSVGRDSAALGTTYLDGKIGRVKITPECLYSEGFIPPSRSTL